MGPPSIEEMEMRLNDLYRFHPVEYTEHKEMLKSLGYKVFRNLAGKHKLEVNLNHLNEVFGGVFV